MIQKNKQNNDRNRKNWKAAQLRAYKKYYEKNRGKIAKIRKNYQKRNADKIRYYGRIYKLGRDRNLRERSDGSVTMNAIRGMMQGQNSMCNLCGIDISIDYHIDHIYPVARGGEHKIENIQLLCPQCNRRKGCKI